MVSDWQARNVGDMFSTVLNSLISGDNDLTVNEVDFFSPHSQAQIMEWNPKQSVGLQDCVHRAIERRVSARPNDPAVCAWDADFTYRKLDELSTQLATHLIKRGVVRCEMVPVCFEKSAWTIVAQLAILKAGGTCVSLDPAHPRERLNTIICDIGAKLLLAGNSVEDRCSGLVSDILVIQHSLFDKLSYSPAALLNTSTKPEDPAFVIYTSGSTGTPKGVVLEHGSVCTSIEAHGSELRIGPKSRVLQFASYVFDISIQDIMTTLARGGCVCVPSERERVNDLAGAINRMGVNMGCLTTTVARLLSPSAVPGLKTLVLAGEPVTRDVVDIWADVDLHNCYGPAESTIYCAHNGAFGENKSPSNIGYGLSSLLWVVDKGNQDRLAPVGCIGELVLEGPLLARGYLNDQEKTAASFFRDPKWTKALNIHQGRRFYKTGDLVRYCEDGTLDYLGRKDMQVKINGQRVELGEIENQMKRNMQGISQVAVDLVSLEQRSKPSVLAAFISLQAIETETGSSGESESPSPSHLSDISPHLQVDLTRLKTELVRLMPRYMVPTVYIPLSHMPLTSSRKIDRTALRRMASQISDEQFTQYKLTASTERRAPTTEMEHNLVELWAKVLSLDPDSISTTDNFQYLHGDSIGAMKLAALAQDAQISLSVADILKSQTLADMAEVAQILSEDDAVAAPEEVAPFALLGADDESERQRVVDNVEALLDFD